MDAIKQHGASPWHRRSFKPCRSMELTPHVEEKENIIYATKRENFVFEPKADKIGEGAMGVIFR